MICSVSTAAYVVSGAAGRAHYSVGQFVGLRGSGSIESGVFNVFESQLHPQHLQRGQLHQHLRRHYAKKIYTNSPFEKAAQKAPSSRIPSSSSTSSSVNTAGPKVGGGTFNPGSQASQGSKQGKQGKFNEQLKEKDFSNLYASNIGLSGKKSSIARWIRSWRLYRLINGTPEDEDEKASTGNAFASHTATTGVDGKATGETDSKAQQRIPLRRLEELANEHIHNEKSRDVALKAIAFMRSRLDLWARLFLPELSKPANTTGKKTFVMKGQMREDSGAKSVFWISIDVKIYLLLFVLGVYCFRAVMSVIDDTKQGALIQDIFKRLVKSKIVLEYGDRFDKLDKEGEENDILGAIASLNRDEMIVLMKAMSWFSLGHRSLNGFFEIGDSNPMVAAILLNSRIYVWMINLLGDPTKVSKAGFTDFEFITECAEVLNRFAHDETVAIQIVEKHGLSILRHVRERLWELKKQGYNQVMTGDSELLGDFERKLYSVDSTIQSIDDLICRIVGFRSVHKAIDNVEFRALMKEMARDRSSAEKLTKSLTGSWWTILNAEHILQKDTTLKKDFVASLRESGYNDLAQKLENNSLMATSVNELWTYTMMHRATLPYLLVAGSGVGLTVLLTFLGTRRHIQRKISSRSYRDDYILPFVNGFTIFLTALCTTHYFVLYPLILKEIRNRVEDYERDVNILFKGSFLPLSIHNYKIFSGYLGSFFLMSAAIILLYPTLFILAGSTLSGVAGIIAQIYTTPNVDHREFFECFSIVLKSQIYKYLNSPARILSKKFVLDEDERHQYNISEVQALNEKASQIMKLKKLEEQHNR